MSLISATKLQMSTRANITIAANCTILSNNPRIDCHSYRNNLRIHYALFKASWIIREFQLDCALSSNDKGSAIIRRMSHDAPHNRSNRGLELFRRVYIIIQSHLSGHRSAFGACICDWMSFLCLCDISQLD